MKTKTFFFLSSKFYFFFKKDIKGPPIEGIQNEEQIFEYIGLEYRKPNERDL